MNVYHNEFIRECLFPYIRAICEGNYNFKLITFFTKFKLCENVDDY